MTKIARYGFYVFLSRLFEGVTAMANSIILARLLGPAGRGKYALILSITILLSALGALGVTDSNVYLINRGKYSINNFISNSICFAFCSSILWLVTFLLFYRLIGYRLLPTLHLNEICLSLAVLPFILLTNYLQNILLGRGSINRFINVNIFFSISPLLFLTFFLLDLKLTLREAIYAYALSYVATCFYTFWSCVRETKAFHFTPNAALARESLTYGLKSNTGTILQTARDQLEAIIIGYFMTSSSVGYYNVAIGISNKLQMLPKSVSYLLFAEISKPDNESGDVLTAKITRNMLWIISPFVVILSLFFSKYIVLILYGRKFLPAQVPMSILFGSVILSAFTFPLGSLFLGQGRPKVYLFASAVSLITTLGLDMWLIPLLGLVGAAIANIFGLSAMAYVYLHIHRKNLPNSLSSFLLLNKDDKQLYVDLLCKIRSKASIQLERIRKHII